METYMIQTKTPASRWYKIHGGLSQIEARDLMQHIAENYGESFEGDSSMSIWEGNELIEYRITPEN